MGQLARLVLRSRTPAPSRWRSSANCSRSTVMPRVQTPPHRVAGHAELADDGLDAHPHRSVPPADLRHTPRQHHRPPEGCRPDLPVDRLARVAGRSRAIAVPDGGWRGGDNGPCASGDVAHLRPDGRPRRAGGPGRQGRGCRMGRLLPVGSRLLPATDDRADGPVDRPGRDGRPGRSVSPSARW